MIIIAIYTHSHIGCALQWQLVHASFMPLYNHAYYKSKKFKLIAILLPYAPLEL